MIRVGEIAYANCVPICAAFRRICGAEGYTFVTGEPAVLNRMLHAGEIDVAPCSSFEYARHAPEYLVIPDLSISSNGEVKSVLLSSRRPIERLDGGTILLSPASATSNVLIRILLRLYYGHGCTYLDSDPNGSADAEVTIGNPALQSYLKQSGPGYLYDLSLLWKEMTGLPFVFALWILRREAAAEMPREVAALVRDLLRARDYARARFPEMAAALQEEVGIPAEELVRYWETISYDLDEGKISSLGRFFTHAHELGLVQEVPPLVFYRPS